MEPGAVVCGDSWRGYRALEADYNVLTVNKGRGQMSYYDEDFEVAVHTGRIEGVWSQLRAALHVSRGFPRSYVPLILLELMYRKDRRNIFELAKIYKNLHEKDFYGGWEDKQQGEG